MTAFLHETTPSPSSPHHPVAPRGRYNDAFVNNTCVFRTSYASSCGLPGPKGDASFRIGSNRVSSRDGTLSVCAGKVPFATWQAAGHDVHTTLGKWPADAALVAEARALLGF